MDTLNERVSGKVRDFTLPKYSEIPDVGLFLEQTTKYIAGCLAPLEGVSITSSMISNYVKMKLIKSPVKRQYSREQIAYLMVIAVVKNVISLENIQTLFTLQKGKYTVQRAYEYFCMEFENILFYVFGRKETMENVGLENSQLKQMLRNTIITACHKIYLETCFREIGNPREESMVYIG